jgi:lipoprotein-anchoring transpeptidase ErfK/SrfK
MEDNVTDEARFKESEKKNEVPAPFDIKGIGQVINSFLKRLRTKKKLVNVLRIIFFVFIPLLVFFLAVTFILYFVPVLQEMKAGQATEITSDPTLIKDAGYKKQMALTTKDIQRLSRKYNTYSTGLSYIIINTTDNRFSLYKNKKLIREGSCSTGSYKKLLTAEGKSWTFKTPRGKFTIQGKRTNPAWHKPDWAFIEEGVPIPPKDSPLRWEAGVLGDYAMDIGDSYMIHGTIYKRFLGMPVTHGCVRLNDEDLEAVFNTLNIGSKVYIY